MKRGSRIVAAAATAACASLIFGPLPIAHAATPGSVTKTKTVQRYFLDAAGKKTTIDKRAVQLTVDQTANLRSLQLVHVSWSGARPTAGIVGDPNSDLAQNEEYSMVLLECRGIDSANAPAAQRLSPQTCWTQYADERMYYGYDAWPAWRSDALAPRAQRAAFVNVPNGEPTVCKQILIGTSNQRWIPFTGAGGQTFSGGPGGCGGLAPEAAPANLSSLSLPSNETFGVTALDGTGEANFDIFTAEDHSSLGCSQTVPCSLVAIPIMGISCDSAGTLVSAGQRPPSDALADAQANCESTGNFVAGRQIPPGQSGADAVDGRLWWSASNWANRITIPLSFAPPDNACALAGSSTPLNVYGSELMIQATTQWAPKFCLNSKLFDFNHVRTPEPLAATLLSTGGIEGAYISQPPDGTMRDGGFLLPTVMAPTAVTGFGIAFTVDDANGKQVTQLRLDGRLLAKLLTESYPDLPDIRAHHFHLDGNKQQVLDMQNNPLNITQDPEFQALNPGVRTIGVSDAASTLLTMSSDSDVMYALTSYINADPDARAWLDGRPDPWGMTVNPAYTGLKLPVSSWPLLDSFKPDLPSNDCYKADPVPYLPLVAAPTARLFNIGQDMQFSIAQSQTVCVLPDPNGTLAGAKLVAQGRQQPGARFMLGVVSLGDAEREGLQLAELETQKSSAAPDVFTDTTGRTFVAPTLDSLRSAAQLLTPNWDGTYWSVPYHTLRFDPAGAQAYPGTMVVYAAVPTKGLPVADAKNYATLIRYGASTLQQPGVGQGELPPGYLPMTASNGLSDLASYADVAAAAINAQKGATPSVYAVLPPPTKSTGTSTPSNESTVPVQPTGTQGDGVPSGPGTSSPSSSPSASVSGSATTTPHTSAAALTAATPKYDTGNIALLVPVLAGAVILFAGAALGVRVTGRRGGHT